MNNEKDDLRKLQLIELSLLDRFKEICEINNLRYYLLGGTLLGAIRHGGFIPWDDDIDVCMPRKDYDIFLEVCLNNPIKDIDVKSHDRNEDYRYPFARMSTSKMQIINHSAIKPRVEDVWIDIIPLDGLPKSKIARGVHKIKLAFWWNLNQIAQYEELVDQKRKRSLFASFCVKLAGIVHHLVKVNYKTCLKHLDKNLKKYKYDEEEIIINFVAAYGFQETFPKKAFAEGKKYLFEGKEYFGPVDYDCVCKQIYGDYMTLPPENERNKHNAEIIRD